MADQSERNQELDIQKDPIINCHTHIFTGDYVPPYLGRTFVPAFLYKKVTVTWLIRLMRRKYADQSADQYFQDKHKRKADAEKSLALAESRSKRITHSIIQFLTVWLSLNIFLVVFDDWFSILPVGSWLDSAQGALVRWINIDIPLKKVLWLLPLYWAPGIIQFAVIVISFLVVKPLKSWAVFVLDKAGYDWFIPDDMTKDMIRRYLQLGQFARYRRQQDIMDRLEEQHPPDSQFIILPMDMKYMGAGPLRTSKGALPAEYLSDLKRNKTNRSKAEEKLQKHNNGINPLSQNDLDAEKEKIADALGAIDRIESLRDVDYYYLQLDKLKALKRNRGAIVRPFIFVDPRRIRATKGDDVPFFDCDYSDPYDIALKRCKLGDYLFGDYDDVSDRYDRSSRNDNIGFSGLKIYPALGYYPFDKDLLPLWAYAAQNEIPIMTHCTRGVVFYRGKDIPSRNFHPIFKESDTGDKLPLPHSKNKEYQVYFTHPLNYLCLLDPRLLDRHLQQVLGEMEDQDEKKQLEGIFYPKRNGRTEFNEVLKKLKICFGHYGGSSQWERFYEEDRSRYSREIFSHPEQGIRFHRVEDEEVSDRKLEDIWNGVEWYSVISSLMLQYPNIYADISYTLHQTDIFPLLKRCLRHDRGNEATAQRQQEGLPVHALGERILYGTDFYVVRSNKSDKQLLMETRAQLTEEQFDLIARVNPRRYLFTEFDSLQ